jgi:hypothetical protein
MLDPSISYYRYSFLGCEFLTWLWYSISTSNINRFINKGDSIEIGNRIVLERRVKDSAEGIIIKGKIINLEEGFVSLKKGAVVKEINLIYKSGDKEWFFTVIGESLSLKNIKTPATGTSGSENDVDEIATEKIFLFDVLFSLLDDLFKNFIKIRVSNKWAEVFKDIKNWIYT